MIDYNLVMDFFGFKNCRGQMLQVDPESLYVAEMRLLEAIEPRNHSAFAGGLRYIWGKQGSRAVL